MTTVKVTEAMATDALRGINWTAVDATTDEEIARQVAGNPNAAPIQSDAELDRATFGERVRAIRERLRLTQPAFAERFGFPTASLRDWEQGRRKPDAATTAYLAVIEHEPEAVMRALEKLQAA